MENCGRKPSLDDAGRQTLMELHERGFSQQECADALATSERTIRRESRKLGITWTGGIKAETREASAKARIDRIREKRAALAEALLGDAEELRQRLFEEYEDSAFVGGAAPSHIRAVLHEPKAQDQAHIVRSIGEILAKTEKVLADPADAADTANSVLGHLAAALEKQNEDRKNRGVNPGVEDDLQDNRALPGEHEQDTSKLNEMDALEAEEEKLSPVAKVARRRTEFCDLGTECPNKARPHRRGTGPCVADPLSLEDASRP